LEHQGHSTAAQENVVLELANAELRTTIQGLKQQVFLSAQKAQWRFDRLHRQTELHQEALKAITNRNAAAVSPVNGSVPVESVTDRKRKWVPGRSAGRQPQTFGDRDVTSASREIRENIWKLFRRIKDAVGDSEDVDALMVFMLTKYSEDFKYRSKKGGPNAGMGSGGVTAAKKIFGSPLGIFTRIPGLLDDFTAAVKLTIKESISREEFVELVESTGMDRADLRLWRRKFPKLFQSEYACDQEMKLLKEEADKLLGPTVQLEHTKSKCKCHDFSKLAVKDLQKKCEEYGLPSWGL
jgi:hypothetical protein